MDDQSDDIHPLVKGFSYVVIGFFVLYGMWATVIAFIGGRLPIIGLRLPGDIISGLLWLFIADPILMTVGYWISMIIILPIQVVISWLGD